MADIEWPLTAIPENQEFWLDWATSRTTSTFTRQQQVMGRPGAERWTAKVTIGRYKRDSAIAFDALMSSMKGGIQTVLMPDFRRLGPSSAEYRSYRDWLDEQLAGDTLIYFDSGTVWDATSIAVGALLTEAADRLLTEAGDVLQDETIEGDVGALLTEAGDRLVTEDSTLPGGPSWALLAEEAAALFEFMDDPDAPEAVALSSGATGGSTVGVTGLAPSVVAFKAGDLIQTSPGRAHEVAADAISDANGNAVLMVRPRLRTPVVPGPLLFPARARMRIDSSDAARNPTRAPVVSTYEVSLTEDLNL